jgi:hypothetical protein
MKRIITTSLSALLVAFLLGMTGCDGGGGVEPGMPTDTTPGIPPDVMKNAADMSKSTPPPSTKPLTPKATEGAPAEADKKKD